LLVAPGLLASGIVVWLQPWSTESKLVLLGAELLACLLIGAALHDHIVRPLQTLANVVGALREEDYSFRARLAVPNDALGELSLEVNSLADLLALHRTGAIEATALLQRVVEEVDVPILAFDPGEKLRLVNSAGEKLLQQSSERLLGKTASELGLEGSLSCENETLVRLHFSSDARWFVRRSSFRQRGVPHTLVVLSDVSRALREEERRAWQRLIRVMGHELNNSLAPIKSIAGSLLARVDSLQRDEATSNDFRRGLGVMESRADALHRFVQSYRHLAQLPPPRQRPVSLGQLMERVVVLEQRLAVQLEAGPPITLDADSDQIEQMLINLLANAVDASLSNGSQPVRASWAAGGASVRIVIEDRGLGIANPENLFVPFYTTKSAGSGIGLALAQQIARAHGGDITLVNREDGDGARAIVQLPLASAASNLKPPAA
jgi:nitrogen fixation/metabolism regulation signal transduction histidine kinase